MIRISEEGFTTKEFYIDSDGIRLHSKLDCPEGLDKGPLCILIHGFTGNMEEDHLIAVQKALNSIGVFVLRTEMYGHGGSDGEFKNHTLYKWLTNALSVVHYARAQSFVTDLYICGHSQGGLLTMMMAGMCADYFKAAMPLSPAWMIPETCRRGSVLGAGFDAENIPDKIISEEWELSGDYIRVAQSIYVEEQISRYKGPVLIVHGDRDETVPISYSEKAAGLYQNATFVTIRGGDHCFIGYEAELAKAVKTFVNA